MFFSNSKLFFSGSIDLKFLPLFHVLISLSILSNTFCELIIESSDLINLIPEFII